MKGKILEAFTSAIEKHRARPLEGDLRYVTGLKLQGDPGEPGQYFPSFQAAVIDSELSDCKIGDWSLMRMRFIRTRFVRCTFYKTFFCALQLIDCEFLACKFTRITFAKCEFDNVRFAPSPPKEPGRYPRLTLTWERGAGRSELSGARPGAAGFDLAIQTIKSLSNLPDTDAGSMLTEALGTDSRTSLDPSLQRLIWCWGAECPAAGRAPADGRGEERLAQAARLAQQLAERGDASRFALLHAEPAGFVASTGQGRATSAVWLDSDGKMAWRITTHLLDCAEARGIDLAPPWTCADD